MITAANNEKSNQLSHRIPGNLRGATITRDPVDLTLAGGMMTRFCKAATLALCIIGTGCTRSLEAPVPAPPPVNTTPSYDVYPRSIRWEDQGTVFVDPSAGFGTIPAERRDAVVSGMTFREIVDILGPGYIPDGSSAGSVLWYFDDNMMFTTGPSPRGFDAKCDLYLRPSNIKVMKPAGPSANHEVEAIRR